MIEEGVSPEKHLPYGFLRRASAKLRESEGDRAPDHVRLNRWLVDNRRLVVKLWRSRVGSGAKVEPTRAPKDRCGILPAP
jgi:hypothetical protein